jgi:cysteine synthase
MPKRTAKPANDGPEVVEPSADQIAAAAALVAKGITIDCSMHVAEAIKIERAHFIAFLGQVAGDLTVGDCTQVEMLRERIAKARFKLLDRADLIAKTP